MENDQNQIPRSQSFKISESQIIKPVRRTLSTRKKAITVSVQVDDDMSPCRMNEQPLKTPISRTPSSIKKESIKKVNSPLKQLSDVEGHLSECNVTPFKKPISRVTSAVKKSAKKDPDSVIKETNNIDEMNITPVKKPITRKASVGKKAAKVVNSPLKQSDDIDSNLNDLNITPFKKPISRANSAVKKPVIKDASPSVKYVNDLETLFQEKMDLKCRTEQYFFHQTDKSGYISSKKTLADLGKNRITADEAAKLMKKLPLPSCIKDIRQRVLEIERDIFPKIILQLKKNFNVLLHGFGSKLDLLESFIKRYLSCENCIVVPGFNAGVSFTQVLGKIVEQFAITVTGSLRSPSMLMTAIRDHFNGANGEHLYLALHNLDGPAIINNLEIIYTLLRSPFIHVVATIDHIDVDRLIARYDWNWVWYDCATFLPYSIETQAGNSRLMSNNGATGLESLRAVMVSLNDTAKQVFLILAKYQQENKESKYDGMPMDILFRKCRDAFFVNNEGALRLLLTEFRDHKLIVFKLGSDRSECVTISLDNHLLQEFIDNFNTY